MIEVKPPHDPAAVARQHASPQHAERATLATISLPSARLEGFRISPASAELLGTYLGDNAAIDAKQLAVSLASDPKLLAVAGGDPFSPALLSAVQREYFNLVPHSKLPPTPQLVAAAAILATTPRQPGEQPLQGLDYALAAGTLEARMVGAIDVSGTNAAIQSTNSSAVYRSLVAASGLSADLGVPGDIAQVTLLKAAALATSLVLCETMKREAALDPKGWVQQQIFDRTGVRLKLEGPVNIQATPPSLSIQLGKDDLKAVALNFGANYFKDGSFVFQDNTNRSRDGRWNQMAFVTSDGAKGSSSAELHERTHVLNRVLGGWRDGGPTVIGDSVRAAPANAGALAMTWLRNHALGRRDEMLAFRAEGSTALRPPESLRANDLTKGIKNLLAVRNELEPGSAGRSAVDQTVKNILKAAPQVMQIFRSELLMIGDLYGNRRFESHAEINSFVRNLAVDAPIAYLGRVGINEPKVLANIVAPFTARVDLYAKSKPKTQENAVTDLTEMNAICFCHPDSAKDLLRYAAFAPNPALRTYAADAAVLAALASLGEPEKRAELNKFVETLEKELSAPESTIERDRRPLLRGTIKTIRDLDAALG